MQRIAGIGFLLLSLTAAAQKPAPQKPVSPKPVPMSTYHDANGVSFDYPKVWTQQKDDPEYIPTYILMNSDGKPDTLAHVIVLFSPKGNVYQKTNLSSLSFTYTTKTESEAQCNSEAITATGANPSQPDQGSLTQLTIHGVPFQRLKFAEGAMCHQVDAAIFWTYRDGVCHLFEADFRTICPGVVDGQRGLTDTETRALTRHLMAIPMSIRFAPQAANSATRNIR